MAIRTIQKTYAGTKGMEGAGVRLTCIFSQSEVEELDPFLLLDFFDSENADDYTKRLLWHPHRGIETIAYLIDGRLEHGDSLGDKGVIESLGCQWMTARKDILWSYDNYFCSFVPDLLKILAQLRHMPAAEESHESAVEDKKYVRFPLEIA